MRRIIALITFATAVALALVVPTLAAADPIAIGDPIANHSAVFRGSTSFALAAAARPAAPDLTGLSLDRIRRKSADGEGEGQAPPAPAGRAPVVQGTPVAGSPGNLLTSFEGLDAFDNQAVTGLNVEPPDQGLCVGNGFVLESINITLRVFDDAGAPLTPAVDQNAFYGLPPGFDPTTDEFGPFITDPSCLFDPETGRFFHVVLTLEADPVTGDPLGPNFLDIAVSQTSDPTGAWNLYRIDATNDGSNGTVDHDCDGGPCIGDYPHLGLDHNGFFITTNEYAFFGDGFSGAQLYVMSKAALAAGAPSVPFVMFENLEVPERAQVGFTLRAANAPATEWASVKNGTVYFLSGMVGSETGNPVAEYDAVTLWALSNTASLDTPTPALKLRHRVVNTQPYQIPPPATQRPGPLPLGDCLDLQPCIDAFGAPPETQDLSVLDSLDGRMLGTWFAAGELWFALGTAVEVGGQELAGVMYGVVEPSWRNGNLRGAVRLQEYLGVEGNNLIMPAVGVDAAGRGYLVFTLVGPDHFPSAAVAKVSLAAPATKLNVVAPGIGPQDGFSGYWIGGPRPRWGDYAYAAVDEQGNVWLAVEYIAQTCTFAQWIGGDLTCGGERAAFANFSTRVMELR